MAKKLELDDTLNTWRNKINESIDEPILGSFNQDIDNISGLDFAVVSGKFRDGSDVTTVSGGTFTLTANATEVLVLYSDPSVTELRVYDVNSVPNEDVIPLYQLTTDGTDITNIEDLRTWVTFGGGGTGGGSVDGILQIEQQIDFDTTIESGKNALSIDPIIDSGVTVTVSQDSTWVIL